MNNAAMAVTRSRVSLRVGVAIAVLLLAVVLTGGANLWATYAMNRHFEDQFRQQTQQQQTQQQAQQQTQQLAQQQTDAKICSSFQKLADLKPPAGNAADNPSRAYDQRQHDILVGIGTDIGCK